MQTRPPRKTLVFMVQLRIVTFMIDKFMIKTMIHIRNLYEHFVWTAGAIFRERHFRFANYSVVLFCNNVNFFAYLAKLALPLLHCSIPKKI